MFYALCLSATFCFGGDDQPDLVKKLGHPRFAVRDRAQVRLLKITDFESYFAIQNIKTNDAEVIGRRKLIMESFQQRMPEKLRPNYKVDLMGYPKYPWICQEFHYHYEWNGMRKYQLTNHYLCKAGRPTDPLNNYPDYARFRTATELWLADRIELSIKNAIVCAKSEDEFCEKMATCMRQIQEDIAAMIRGEDYYWRFQGYQNPLRSANIKKN